MSDSFLESMGKRVLAARKALDYSQEKVAETANVTYQTISSCENGQTELKAKSIVGIADALEISADYLLAGRRTEYDLHLLDKRALGLTDKQFNYFKKVYLDFIELCVQGEFE